MADSSYYLRDPQGAVVAVRLVDNGDGTYSIKTSAAAGGGGTEYTEDAAAAANPVGTALVLVREDARAGSLVSADGDNVVARGNNKGEQYVIDTDAVTALQIIDDWDETDRAKVNLIAGQAGITAGAGAVGASTPRVTLASDDPAVAALQVLDNAISGSEMQVDVVGALPAGANNIGDVDVLSVPAPLSTTGGGTEATALRVTLASDSTGLVSVDDNGAALTVDNAGTFVVQIDGTALTALQLIDNLVLAEDAASANADPGVQVLAVRDDTLNIRSGTEGDYEPLHTDANGALWIHPTDSVAHDAADAGNGLKIAAKAETALSGVTLVADGDRTDLYAGVDGVLIVRPNCNLEDVVQERTTNTDGASTAFASGLAAPGAGIRLWIKSVTICNSSATFCTVDLRDGSGGSVLWTFPIPATGGVTHVFDPPLKLTANTALAFDASAATTTLTISANGFKSKV